MPFPHMLSTLQVGPHVLRNRVVMGSMHTRLEQMDGALERQMAFYEARAAGGVAMLVTGGFSPNEEGRLEEGGPLLSSEAHVAELKPVVDAVHRHGAKFLAQLLHAGRYAKHAALVGVSAHRSPINPRTPHRLSDRDVERTLEDFVRSARLALEAGFDGVELMGSEGYLINQFTAPRTNDREDRWGGTLENRCRFSVELVRRIRQELGAEFLVMYRISAADLIEGGSSAEETDYLARAVEAAGADILNTGYGWHEAPVPTIAYQVPRAAWAGGAARLKRVVRLPVVASNRINRPEVADELVASGAADLVSMARPLLADPEFVNKAAENRASEINVCIACNQACLDHIFTNRTATCLVNPRACRELDFPLRKALRPRRIAVVGAGPGGLSAAIEAARRGHRVTLFDRDSELGGQLNLARRVPGKTEFDELLRYFAHQIQIAGVEVVLGCSMTGERLRELGFEHSVVATGIVPRWPDIPGIRHAKVLSYPDVLNGRVRVGRRVVIIGTGGIAHDVAEFLSEPQNEPATVARFFSEWGVAPAWDVPGVASADAPRTSTRQITLFQRGEGRVGERLGRSTGWIVRNRLRRRGVRWVSGVSYLSIDDEGLRYEQAGQAEVEGADHVVICAGQEAASTLASELRALGMPFDLIGGARLAMELDAARAIAEGTEVAQNL